MSLTFFSNRDISIEKDRRIWIQLGVFEKKKFLAQIPSKRRKDMIKETNIGNIKSFFTITTQKRHH